MEFYYHAKTRTVNFFHCREKSAPVGFQYSLNVTKESDVKEEMTSCLDRWQTRQTSKKKKKATKKVDVDEQSEVAVESLGKGTAVLLPKEGTAVVWNISSEDDSEPEVIQSSSKPMREGTYHYLADKLTLQLNFFCFTSEAPQDISDESEEEKVIVINANRQTRKRNKKQRM